MTGRTAIRTLLAIGGLACTITLLVGIGEILGPPHQAMPWPTTIDDPTAVAVDLVRIGSMTGAAWLLVLTVADLVAGGLGLTRLRAHIGALAPAFWRNIVLKPVATLAVIAPPTLMPVMVASPVAAQIVEVSGAPEVSMAIHDPGPVALSVGSDLPTITMRVHDPRDDIGAPIAPAVHTPTDSATNSPTTHVVVSGDNLWSIAASHLTDERGARPTSAEITPYWQALIEANRHVLPDPENPGLLFPGIELQLPPTA